MFVGLLREKSFVKVRHVFIFALTFLITAALPYRKTCQRMFLFVGIFRRL